MMIREFLGRVERLEKVAAEQRRLRGMLGWERGAWGSVNMPFPTLPLSPDERRVIRVNLEGELPPPLRHLAASPRFKGVVVEVGQRYVKVSLLEALLWGALAPRVNVLDLIIAALLHRFLLQQGVDFLALVEEELEAPGLLREQREILNLVNAYMEGDRA
ncbi:MAG: hypothetical protein QXU69_11775 [Thermofilaceae archaeon]